MEDESLKHWVKTYLLDILCGMVFWGALFLCYLQGCYYHANGMAGKKILMICVGVLYAGLFLSQGEILQDTPLSVLPAALPHGMAAFGAQPEAEAIMELRRQDV